MSTAPTRVFAVDHRVPLLDEARRRGVSADRCREFKLLAVEAFEAARHQSAAVRQRGGMLLDSDYGLDALRLARTRGIPVGMPGELPGQVPLKLYPDLESRLAELRPDFLKCLVRGRPDHPGPLLHQQHDTLRQLTELCARHQIPLVLELIIPRANEPEDLFPSQHRPTLTASWIEVLHARGVFPAQWKLEGAPDPRAAGVLAAALAPGEQIVLLGNSAPADELSSHFAAVRGQPAFVGFAVGRSIFWRPFLRHLEGGSPAEVVGAMRDAYLDVVARWECT